MPSPFLWIALICLAGGLLALFLARLWRRQTGLPHGAVRYTDTGPEGERPESLFSRRYRLAGRPDYLIQKGRQMIPVEVKSSLAPAKPRHAHVLQLAAYCLLVEEPYGAPPYGILRYANGAFEVPYTPALRQELLDTLAAMRSQLRSAVPPAKPAGRPCHVCGYAGDCDAPPAPQRRPVR